MINNIVDEHKSLEFEALKKIEQEDKYLADQRAFELEKLKLQAKIPPASIRNSSQMDSSPMRMDLKTVLSTFIPDKDDIVFNNVRKTNEAPKCTCRFLGITLNWSPAK
ncbi:hypothetical protein TNCV_5084281 [Trichonephila clavipes]|nr:hypothetical protein TNCV_5084281 [Trichonephila clavipes]